MTEGAGMTDRQEPLTPDMWGGLEAEARAPGPTMTITKAQYAAMRAAIERAPLSQEPAPDERPLDVELLVPAERVALTLILAIVQETSGSLPSRDRHQVERIARNALSAAGEDRP